MRNPHMMKFNNKIQTIFFNIKWEILAVAKESLK